MQPTLNLIPFQMSMLAPLFVYLMLLHHSQSVVEAYEQIFVEDEHDVLIFDMHYSSIVEDT